jgi:HAD superfamily hydrolase (TIGR01509 family)
LLVAMQAWRDLPGFVFDMDGLLLDTERLGLQTWRRAAKELNLPLPEDTFLEMIGRRSRDIRSRLIERVGREDLADQLIALSTQHYDTFIAQGVPVKKGVHELLAWLDSRGRACAVATSTATARAEHKLGAAGLLKYFKTVIGGDRVELGKPAPDIYLRTAKELGVEMAESVVFEDSEPGLQGAHTAGARVVWVPDLAPVSPAAQALAAWKVGSLHEVLAAWHVEPPPA